MVDIVQGVCGIISFICDFISLLIMPAIFLGYYVAVKIEEMRKNVKTS
jgi:hypothetical protein